MKSLATALACALVACSQSPTLPSNALARAPNAPIMLRVTNTSDTAIYIGGFPDLLSPEPQPSGGIIGLGMARPGTICFALPDSIVLSGMNVTTGAASTQVWRAASNGISITGGGYTTHFLAGSAAGWDITVPGTGTVPTPATPCTR